jgi:hypothetical protein
LQEETILALRALCNQSSTTLSTIRMTLNAHGEFVSSASNILHSFEVSIFTITLDEFIITALNTECWWVENHRVGACQAFGVKRSKTFLASGVTWLTFLSSRVKIEPRFACAISEECAIHNRKIGITSTKGASL